MTQGIDHATTMHMKTTTIRQKNYRRRLEILRLVIALNDADPFNGPNRELFIKLYSELNSLELNKGAINVRKKK